MKALAVVAILSAASFAPQDPPKKPAADPAARQEAFLAGLKAGEVAKTYATLFKGSRLEGNAEQIDVMVEQTDKGIKLYGGIVGWENCGIVRQEKHQAFGMGILCCEQVPVYFYFVWYRNAESAPWVLINSWFSDQAKDYWSLRK